MNYFYRKIAMVISLGIAISPLQANHSLKECIDKCHKKCLNLKDFKNCKNDCVKTIHKRSNTNPYQKNYSPQASGVMPAVETTVRAATPEQAELAAAAATGAAASVLSATTPQPVTDGNLKQSADQSADTAQVA